MSFIFSSTWGWVWSFYRLCCTDPTFPHHFSPRVGRGTGWRRFSDLPVHHRGTATHLQLHTFCCCSIFPVHEWFIPTTASQFCPHKDVTRKNVLFTGTAFSLISITSLRPARFTSVGLQLTDQTILKVQAVYTSNTLIIICSSFSDTVLLLTASGTLWN